MTQHRNDESLVLTVKEAAERLKLSQWMIHKLIRDRELASLTIGARRLIPYRDLERFIARRRMAQKGGDDGS